MWTAFTPKDKNSCFRQEMRPNYWAELTWWNQGRMLPNCWYLEDFQRLGTVQNLSLQLTACTWSLWHQRAPNPSSMRSSTHSSFTPPSKEISAPVFFSITIIRTFNSGLYFWYQRQIISNSFTQDAFLSLFQHGVYLLCWKEPNTFLRYLYFTSVFLFSATLYLYCLTALVTSYFPSERWHPHRCFQLRWLIKPVVMWRWGGAVLGIMGCHQTTCPKLCHILT